MKLEVHLLVGQITITETLVRAAEMSEIQDLPCPAM